MEIQLDRQPTLQPGRYAARIIDVEQREGNQAPYITLTFSIDDTKFVVFHNVSLSPKARWKLDELLDAVRAPTSGKMKLQELLGKRVEIFIRLEEFDGKMRPRVYSIAPAKTQQIEHEPTEDTTILVKDVPKDVIDDSVLAELSQIIPNHSADAEVDENADTSKSEWNQLSLFNQE